MNIKIKFYIATIFLVILSSCKIKETQHLFTADTTTFHYSGRVNLLDSKEALLIGAASSIKTEVVGDSLEVYVRGDYAHNFVTLVADGEHLGRFKIDTTANFSLPVKFKNQDTVHEIEIVKATEASSGPIIFSGIKAERVQDVSQTNNKKIEFIGDSITCGAAMDDEFSPCNEGDYHDHHNAYLSYGPTIARNLNTDYMLSSISGWGIYRGWNSEEEANHTIPSVYENTYLNGEGSKPWDFSSYVPDVVTICLGTNDLSHGDGVHKRTPFDSDLFVERYIKFIETVYGHYPRTQIGLLSSPMVSGEDNIMFLECLDRVVAHFNNQNIEKPIQLFKYDKLYVNGCSYHPGINDHKEMAEVLAPFYQNLLESSD
ncbi:hypothetical protein GGR42_000802 [Saonia flava]|uniref:GDSL family lipase n=1 Tax=Saonia flava TaxID=523696 RepID=A0A846QTP9_9FLAO|nr:SGNH/GDSL hydrolase family protein [Saonia flava]NJB70340.1 hypothetical protein [Saonia flava]